MTPTARVREGMKVRSSGGRRLGRVIAVEADGFLIERGILFHHDVKALWEDVVDVTDDEVVVSTHRPGLGLLDERAPGM